MHFKCWNSKFAAQRALPGDDRERWQRALRPLSAAVPGADQRGVRRCLFSEKNPLFVSDIVNALEWSSEKMSAEDLDDDKVGIIFIEFLRSYLIFGDYPVDLRFILSLCYCRWPDWSRRARWPRSATRPSAGSTSCSSRDSGTLWVLGDKRPRIWLMNCLHHGCFHWKFGSSLL